MKPSTHNVTLMLKQLNEGKQDVLAELVPLLYDELRRLAAAYLRRERDDHTLQPTALVHEAYLRLVDQKEVHWQNRSHSSELRHSKCGIFLCVREPFRRSLPRLKMRAERRS
jgi:hypothetical protein